MDVGWQRLDERSESKEENGAAQMIRSQTEVNESAETRTISYSLCEGMQECPFSRGTRIILSALLDPRGIDYGRLWTDYIILLLLTFVFLFFYIVKIFYFMGLFNFSVTRF